MSVSFNVYVLDKEGKIIDKKRTNVKHIMDGIIYLEDVAISNMKKFVFTPASLILENGTWQISIAIEQKTLIGLGDTCTFSNLAIKFSA